MKKRLCTILFTSVCLTLTGCSAAKSTVNNESSYKNYYESSDNSFSGSFNDSSDESYYEENDYDSYDTGTKDIMAYEAFDEDFADVPDEEILDEEVYSKEASGPKTMSCFTCTMYEYKDNGKLKRDTTFAVVKTNDFIKEGDRTYYVPLLRTLECAANYKGETCTYKEEDGHLIVEIPSLGEYGSITVDVDVNEEKAKLNGFSSARKSWGILEHKCKLKNINGEYYITAEALYRIFTCDITDIYGGAYITKDDDKHKYEFIDYELKEGEFFGTADPNYDDGYVHIFLYCGD